MTAAAETPLDARRSRMSDIAVLAKVRLNALVVATTAGGYYMGTTGPMNVLVMAATCAGTALVASGASAFNQIHERDLDRLMTRTRQRPVAEGRMSVTEANWLAYGFSGAGLLILWLVSGALPAIVAAATLVSYIAIYTPLKRRSSLATIVGAIPGALPPLIGWAAARGTLDLAAWSLFLIMFIWQLPHFLAIAWMYREDYAKAGLPMLPVVDHEGAMTGRQALVWAATLVPISVLPSALGLTGTVYAIGAFVLGLGFVGLAFAFARARTRSQARLLFLGSITYLPLLWIVMGFDRR